MKLPLQITFRDVPHSDAVEAVIKKKAAKLDRIADVMACRVVVETPHKNHRHGNLFHCRIDLTVPGKELVVGRDPSEKQSHEDVYNAVNDAFRAAERQLKSLAGKRGPSRT